MPAGSRSGISTTDSTKDSFKLSSPFKPPFRHLSIFTSKNTAETKADLLKKWKAAGVVVVIGDVTNAEDIELIRLAEESGTVKWFYPSYATEKAHQSRLAFRKYARGNVKRVLAGKCMILALRHPQSPERILRLQSFVASPKDILAEAEKQTGAKWVVSYTLKENVKEIEAKRWANEEPDAYAASLRRIWAERGTLY
ncbi:hypothetical protein GQ53DRAFT_800593 [Thozetella sp. PMI_491]|nr:hypothetical protein GQ53DRAFT_800593 [Thozetella sp. PMI_491]